MNCPTCDHEMEYIGELIDQVIRHCPRCGTVAQKTMGEDTINKVIVPNLVDKCRVLKDQIQDRPFKWCKTTWETSGISECINLPEDRTLIQTS